MGPIDVSKIWPGWQVDGLLGRGPYGTVYKISHETPWLTRIAAAKCITISDESTGISSFPAIDSDTASVRNRLNRYAIGILDELRAVRALGQVEGIVSIEDYGIVGHVIDAGLDVWVRTELLRGVETIWEAGEFDIAKTVEMGIDISDALHHCHSHGIIHGHVCPANVFVTPSGKFKISDFGIARRIEGRSVARQKGLDFYVAPEQLRGGSYSEKADVYALGIMMYCGLNNGRLPFMPPAPASVRPSDLSMALSRLMKGEDLPRPANGDWQLFFIVHGACNPDPDQRSSARWLNNELKELRGDTEYFPSRQR